MPTQTLHKKLFIVGQISPGILTALSTDFLVSLSHHYGTVTELMEYGHQTLSKADYTTLLIGEDVTPEYRRQITQFVEKRNAGVTIGVLTTEQSYDRWVAIDPRGSADQIAAALHFSARVDPARVIITASTKGGVGKSTLATNVAITLAKSIHKDGRPNRVALIDDDRTTRSIRTLMGIAEEAPNSADLVAAANQAQGNVTLDVVQRHLNSAHGVETLIGPNTLITDFPLELDTARATLTILMQEMGFDYIVIDSPPDFINTSSFTYSILYDKDPILSKGLVLVPIIPEQILLRSVDDTIATLTHFQHPLDSIWPVINCLRPTQDPETVRGEKVLWRQPVGILPYVPNNQFVGETGVPLAAEEPESFFRRFWNGVILGQSTIKDGQEAYSELCNAIIANVTATKRDLVLA